MSAFVDEALLSTAGLVPDAAGHFGRFGGRFVPEALIAALDELDAAFRHAQADEAFQAEFNRLLRDYANVPSPLYDATRLSSRLGARILLKREDLNHTGAHKVRNVLGQALLTSRMGKPRVIAETGAGQHGVAAATAAALFGLECVVYMGEEDTRRQSLNVARMRMLGATVIPVTTGSRTLKDAMNEALRDWVTNVDSTHYLIGTVAGPHPFPAMVREFARGIGVEARAQCLDMTGRLPDAVCACVGGGSNALGVFHAFIPDQNVGLYGYEAGGDGVATGRHAASITGGDVGVLHGTRTYVLQDEDGQTIESHSISAGLDYPGVGPEHAWLADIGRASYEPVTDAEAMAAFELLCRTEGIIPAIESAHALAGAARLAERLGPEATILVCLSGRGDKDVETAAATSVCSDVGRGGLREGAGGGPGGAGGLPAGRIPHRRRRHRRGAGLAESGVDLVEVGFPYSDPVIDGPTIQRATEIALAAGVKAADVMRTVEAVAQAGVPVVLMTYWNLVERYAGGRTTRGVDSFARDLAAAGGSGLITPDLIPDEAEDWIASRTSSASTGSSWWRRPRPMPGSPRRSPPAGASCTPPASWASPARATPPRRPPRRWFPGSGRPRPRSTPACRSASASGCVTALRRPRWAPTPTGSSSAARSSTACSTRISTRAWPRCARSRPTSRPASAPGLRRSQAVSGGDGRQDGVVGVGDLGLDVTVHVAQHPGPAGDRRPRWRPGWSPSSARAARRSRASTGGRCDRGS
jgi:tryptophan synthase beta chain